MEKKFLMANIKLPVLINEDGSFTTIDDDIEISFSEYEGDRRINENSVLVVTNQVTIKKDEIKKNKKNSLNTTFKNKIIDRIKSSRFTIKS